MRAQSPPTSEAGWLNVRGTRIRRVSRGDFFARRWRYKPGEALAVIAPMQAGKTTLVYQLLEVTTRPSLPAVVLVMKPRDSVPAAWSRHLGYVEVPTWPPRKPYPWEKSPPGYTLWPRHTFHVPTDNAHMKDEIGKALHHVYSHGNSIIFADEVYGLTAELDLTEDLIALWTRGGSMGAGLWVATQRPTGSAGHGIPGHMYSNSTHLFLAKDPDERSRRRFGEIGGVDPVIVSDAVMKLKIYEFLYIHRGDKAGGPYMAVLGQD